MKTGIELIAEERKRQIEVEGWSANHDDRFYDGQMAGAAACYALNACGFVDPNKIQSQRENKKICAIWPFGTKWWNPSMNRKGRIKDLIKAGVLIAAEIDRIQRRDGSE